MRYSVSLALWLTFVGLLAAVAVHFCALLGVGIKEECGLAFPIHVSLMSVGAFAALMYKLRGAEFDASAFPQWSKHPLPVLFGYFVLHMVLLAKFEHNAMFRLACLSSGWILGYAAIAAYLWHLRDGLRAGFREVELR